MEHMRDYVIDTSFDLKKIAPEFRKIFELSLPFLKTRHNEVHTFIVYQYALLLLEKEKETTQYKRFTEFPRDWGKQIRQKKLLLRLYVFGIKL